MATVSYGGKDAVNAILYGQPHQSNIEFFRQQHNNLMNHVSSTGSTILNQLTGTFDKIYSHDAMTRARLLARQSASFWQQDVIRPLVTAESICTAQPVMMRWIMANPVIRDYYHKGMIAGYDEKYNDFAPGSVKHDQPDYRYVVDGVVFINEETGEESRTTYFHSEDDPDYMDLDQQSAILNTWSWAEALLEDGIDVTSKWLTKL